MRRGLQVLATVAAATALVFSGSAAATARGSSHRGYTCTGGDVPSGTYSRITVTGTCDVPAGAVIHVLGDIDVERGATFDAQSAPSTITVGHDVTAAPGSLVGLGCQPPSYTGNSAHPCTVQPDGHSTVIVYGNVTGFRAQAVLLNGVTVGRNVTLLGGGSEQIPWSVKNNVIIGNLTMSGITDEWVGVLFNYIGRNATLTRITLHDVDPGAPGVYIVRNTVGHNLNCFWLRPGVSGGFVPGEVNVVGHRATGQCASLV